MASVLYVFNVIRGVFVALLLLKDYCFFADNRNRASIFSENLGYKFSSL
jgi:hypothetical protein